MIRIVSRKRETVKLQWWINADRECAYSTSPKSKRDCKVLSLCVCELGFESRNHGCLWPIIRILCTGTTIRRQMIWWIPRIDRNSDSYLSSARIARPFVAILSSSASRDSRIRDFTRSLYRLSLSLSLSFSLSLSATFFSRLHTWQKRSAETSLFGNYSVCVNSLRRVRATANGNGEFTGVEIFFFFFFRNSANRCSGGYPILLALLD